MRKKLKIFFVLIFILACWIKIDVVVSCRSDFRPDSEYLFSNVELYPMLESSNFKKLKGIFVSYRIIFVNPYEFYVSFSDKNREYTHVNISLIELSNKNRKWVQKLKVLGEEQGSHDFVYDKCCDTANFAKIRALISSTSNKGYPPPNICIPDNIDEIFVHIVFRLDSKNKSSDHDITIPLKRGKESEYHSKLFASLLR